MASLGQDVEIKIAAKDMVGPGVESARRKFKELERDTVSGIGRNVEAIGKQAQALEKVGKLAITLEAVGAIGKSAFDAISAAASFASGKIANMDAAIGILGKSLESIPVAGRFFTLGNSIGEAIFGDSADAASIAVDTANRERATNAMQRRAAERIREEKERGDREVKAIAEALRQSQEDLARRNKEWEAEKLEKNASIQRSIAANADVDNQAAADFSSGVAAQLATQARRGFEDARSELQGQADFFGRAQGGSVGLGSGEVGRFITGVARSGQEKADAQESLLRKQIEIQERMLKALEASPPQFDIAVGVFN